MSGKPSSAERKMKQLSQTRSLLLMLIAVSLANLDVLAQPEPVFLRLAGVAVGSIGGIGTDLQVVGKHAYRSWAGDTNRPGGVEIFSVTNPTAPFRVGSYESPAPVSAMEVVGQYAYLAGGTRRSFTNDPGVLEIVDVSDPANPFLVAHIDTPGRANGIQIAGNFAYVAESVRWTGSNFLGAVEIFDISTPTNALRVAIFDTPGSVTSIAVSDNHAYLTDGLTDLQVLNVSDHAHPRRVGIYQPDLSDCAFEPLGPANYVEVIGNRAYSAGENGLHMLDISDPSNPIRITDNSCIPIYGLAVAGHHAYMALYSSLLNTYFLHIADTTNPTDWAWVGSKRDWYPGPMQIVDNLLYLAANPLLVYEISDGPTITFRFIDAESLVLTWDFAAGFALQSTPLLSNPVWSDVPGSENQNGIELRVTNGGGFFRLARSQPTPGMVGE